MRIGIDLGGTKTEIIALHIDGRELYRKRINTPRDNYDSIVSSIVSLVLEAESKLEQKGKVGIGIPGAISPGTGLIKNANTTCLIGRPFDLDLSKQLNRPVRLANDANCFTLSEAVDGAGREADVVFGVIIGTGTGGGITVGGRILVGQNAITGEWGHNPMPWPNDDERPGPKCYCGKTSCIETYLSGPGLESDHYLRTGVKLTSSEINRAAMNGDSNAEKTFLIYEDRMARALASVINVLDPNVIVLGGGLSNLDRLYRNIPKLLKTYVFSDEVSTEVRPAQHGDSSGVRGAAWLWPKEA